ncbi:MAG: hypothetical protein WC901_04145 [Candidatus Margulisiibacteriota bacterium]
MSIFEAGMLICFGASWPISIYKSYKARSNAGKSFLFLAIVFSGYLLGITHKILYNFDAVFWLYLINCLLMMVDMGVYVRNMRIKPKPARDG